MSEVEVSCSVRSSAVVPAARMTAMIHRKIFLREVIGPGILARDSI